MMVARLTARPKLVIPFAELSSFELRSFSRIPRAIRRPLSCKGGFLHGQICTISGLAAPLTLVIQFTAVSQLPLLNLVIENPQNDQQPLNCQEIIFEITFRYRIFVK